MDAERSRFVMKSSWLHYENESKHSKSFSEHNNEQRSAILQHQAIILFLYVRV